MASKWGLPKWEVEQIHGKHKRNNNSADPERRGNGKNCKGMEVGK